MGGSLGSVSALPSAAPHAHSGPLGDRSPQASRGSGGVSGPDPISLEQFDEEVGDHHEGYYYPPPQTVEKYQSRVVTLMDSDEIRRQGFVIGIARQQMAAQYAPDYAIFTKGEHSQKLIIVGLHDGSLDTIYRARALFANMTLIARSTPFFQKNTQPEEATFFDLLKLRPAERAVDSQGGFNVHTMALNIPIEELGGDHQIVGVYATTSRRRVKILGPAGDTNFGDFVQVGRQGNPLFNEGLVAIKDKDLYSRTSPEFDSLLFKKYALTPELASLINALVLGANVAPTANRTDIAGIFIPDLIKVDLSTGPARLAGGGASHPTNPDDVGFSRLGIFGGDND